MKKVLLLMVVGLMVSSVAMADHIGVYVNEAGVDCYLASGFTQTATVVYRGWTPGGSTGARFKVTPPAGSSLFGFLTPYVTIGTIQTDLSIAFGTCIEGTFPLGTIAAVWVPGIGAVVAPDPFPLLMTDCAFGEYPITGGSFCVVDAGFTLDGTTPSAGPTAATETSPEPGCHECTVATEPSTWGKVKAMYR